jgi:hypothetical protein
MERIKEHKDYLIGMTLTCLIGAIVMTFGPDPIEYPIVIYIPMRIVSAIIFCAVIGGLVLGVSWIFTKNFTLTRFVKICTVTSVLWTLSVILYTVKSII